MSSREGLLVAAIHSPSPAPRLLPFGAGNKFSTGCAQAGALSLAAIDGTGCTPTNGWVIRIPS